MERLQRLVRMCALMIAFGVMLGAIAGSLVGATLLMLDASPGEILREFISLIVLSVTFGGSFGGLFGGMSGFFSGLVMALVTAVAFGEIRNVKVFRWTMGIITALVTVSVFVLGGLWSFFGELDMTWTAAMLMSVVIAVYASQIVSKKHVNSLMLRKKKVDAS